MVEVEVTLILPTWLNLKDKDSKSEISVRFRTMIQADSLYLLQLKFMADDPNVEQELAFQEFKTKSTLRLVIRLLTKLMAWTSC